eukprot:1955730-Rhodomonas_salina.2
MKIELEAIKIELEAVPPNLKCRFNLQRCLQTPARSALLALHCAQHCSHCTLEPASSETAILLPGSLPISLGDARC